jgi:threonine dehydratase
MNADAIRAAARRLAPYAQPTPLVRALLLSRDLGADVFVKNETVSPVASFKWRGALNAILRDAPRGVVTSSTGNHGQGVAWAAGVAKIPAHVFLPLNPNPTKRAKIELLGATIHEVGHDLDAAKEIAIAFAAREGLAFIDDGESEAVIEGAGTMGLEIGWQLAVGSGQGNGDGLPPTANRQPPTVFVPMGSGSLAGGVALAIKDRFPSARVVAVQSSGAPAMVESFRARRAIERPAKTIADGLICRVPARLALDALLAHVDDAVTVTDDELIAAARVMALKAHVLVEPSGAASLAAALHENLRGQIVVLIATGANITEL